MGAIQMARLKSYVELYRYTVPIEFGTMVSTEDEDGTSRPFFVPSFTLKAASYTVLSGEQSLNSGPNQQEENYYAVQEINKVKLNMLARIQGVKTDKGVDKIYTVNQVNLGNGYDPRSYDLLRLVWGNGVEVGYRNAGV